MGISGIYSLSSSYYQKRTAEQAGVQIDLLIDRNDQVINLFEIKFYNDVFTLSQAYSKNLRQKMSVFRATIQTKKQLFWVMLTTHGLAQNKHSLGLIAQSLTMDDLFLEL